MGFLGLFLAANLPGLIPERIDPKGRATLCDLEVVRYYSTFTQYPKNIHCHNT